MKSEQVSWHVFVHEEARKLPLEHGFEYELLPPALPLNADFLANERVKCFVSHAGSGAVQEAFWFAKPMLCIPQIRDQPYNAWVVENLGAGRTISRNRFSKSRVSHYLKHVLYDTEIRENISRYSQEVRKLNSEEAIRAYLFSTMRL